MAGRHPVTGDHTDPIRIDGVPTAFDRRELTAALAALGVDIAGLLEMRFGPRSVELTVSSVAEAAGSGRFGEHRIVVPITGSGAFADPVPTRPAGIGPGEPWFTTTTTTATTASSATDLPATVTLPAVPGSPSSPVPPWRP